MMGWFEKKKEIVKVCEYSTKGILWRIVPTASGYFIGEDRDTEDVSFFCIDSNSGIERWRISFDEKWWIGIESFHRSYVIFHEYATPELPGHKNIHVVDSIAGNVLWSNYELKYLFAKGDYLYAEREEHIRNIYVEIDIRNGKIIREVGEKVVESLRRESSQTIADRIIYPVQVDVLDDHPSTVKTCYHFIKNKYSEPVFIEYIFHQKYIIMGYYLRNDVQEIACYNYNNGKIIYRDVIKAKATVPSVDSFLMMNNYIYYVREKRTLIGIQIKL